jgi:hypothetical protein
MAKKRSVPTDATILISDIQSFTAGADESGDGTLYVDMRVKLGDQGAFVDLLHGALRVVDKAGAYDAIKALILDQDRLMSFVQAHLATSTSTSSR